MKTAENTQETSQNQLPEPWLVFARAKRLKITQKRIARELNRSQGAVARAFRGERKTLLSRIVRLLDRIERYRTAA